MGGRGQKSASAVLPQGAVGMTVMYPDGTKSTFAVSNGMLMQARAVDDAFNPVKGVNSGIRELYDKAIKKGLTVTLHSKSDMAKGRAFRTKRKSENALDIAKVEMQPNAGRTGIPASRLLSRQRKRGR